MEIYDLFYKWVPIYLRIPVLVLLFFVILCANGVFLGNLTDMASSLGMYPEHYTAAVNAMYIGMALALMTQVRLKMRFSSKALLLAGLTVMLLMNIVCATTSNPWITILAVFILGFAKMSALMEVYITQLLIWSKQLDTSRFYPFVYFHPVALALAFRASSGRRGTDLGMKYAPIRLRLQSGVRRVAGKGLLRLDIPL